MTRSRLWRAVLTALLLSAFLLLGATNLAQAKSTDAGVKKSYSVVHAQTPQQAYEEGRVNGFIDGQKECQSGAAEQALISPNAGPNHKEGYFDGLKAGFSSCGSKQSGGQNGGISNQSPFDQGQALGIADGKEECQNGTFVKAVFTPKFIAAHPVAVPAHVNSNSAFTFQSGYNNGLNQGFVDAGC